MTLFYLIFLEKKVVELTFFLKERVGCFFSTAFHYCRTYKKALKQLIIDNP